MDHWRGVPETEVPTPGQELQPLPDGAHNGNIVELGSSLLVLESYVTLFDRTWDRWQNMPESGVLVTGQPGTGTSQQISSDDFISSY